MATIKKHIDPGSDPFGRAITVIDTDITGAGDVIDVVGSLGHAGRYLEITTGVGDSISVRINSITTTYGLDATGALRGLSLPDWSNSTTHTNVNAPSLSVDASDTGTFTDLPISNIEIVAITAADGITITVR